MQRKDKKIQKPFSTKKKKEILKPFFPEVYPWRGKKAEWVRVLHNLSAARPRWALQLCRMAISRRPPASSMSDRLDYSYIDKVLPEYGELRIQQTVAEHSHQCNSIRDIIIGFAKKGSLYNTEKLLFVTSGIIEKLNINLYNNNREVTAMDIAHFLYIIGFISAVDRFSSSRREDIYRYVQKPYLLNSKTNVDGGFEWRVHPAYWGALQLTGVR